MSWYFSYYLGYIDKNGILFPIGPFDYKGRLYPILQKSRSFASEIHYRFTKVDWDSISDDLIRGLYPENYKELDKNENPYISYLPTSSLEYHPIEKRGYFLIEDIESYLKGGDTFELFYDSLSPEIYAMKVENELKFGPPGSTTDCEGYEYVPHSVKDYAYFSYIDTCSEEYEESVLINGVNMFEYIEIPDGAEMVIILSEG